MAKTQGSLALDSARAATPSPKKTRVRTRRVVTPLFPEGNPRAVSHTAGSVRRGVARGRGRAVVLTVVCVVVFFGVFGTLLINQSRIMEAQFKTTEMEIRIAQLKQDRAILEEEIMKGLDLGRIRLSAIDRLGMQEAGRNKIISVGAATSDLLILNTDNGSEVRRDESVRLESILGNLEGFFKSLR
ncbi:MAG: hypothetical protein GX153_07675 [Clostridiaceae bacterium]|nr:hypothetical protein [Clostridiaceae bacterium]